MRHKEGGLKRVFIFLEGNQTFVTEKFHLKLIKGVKSVLSGRSEDR